MVTGRKRRLLLADDSVTIQKVVELTFSDEGLEVIAVGDGRQALERLEESAPDIVLADAFMPGISGYKICEYIKRSERLRHIPVLLLVGSFEPFDEEEARRVGADDYLTKPFQSIKQLIGKVGGLLSGKRRGSEEETTRKLTPPPEMQQQEARIDQDFLERSTADTAPLPQSEKLSGAARGPSFTDISMDDEMIEATPATTYGSSKRSAESVYARQTTQYSAADLKEAGISQTMQSEPASKTHDEFGEQFSQTIAGEDRDALATSERQEEATRPPSFAYSDDVLLDLGETDAPASLREDDEFVLDLQEDEAPAPRSAGAASESSFAETLPSMPWEASPPSSVEITESAPPQAQEFVKPEVVGEEQAAETALVEAQAETASEDEPAATQSANERAFDMQTAPTERLPQDFHMGETTPAAPPADESEQSSARAASSAGQITLEQLSPEVIDAIARRAVEQLSERVVERIAWEVVPELADLHIKRRLDEERQ